MHIWIKGWMAELPSSIPTWHRIESL